MKRVILHPNQKLKISSISTEKADRGEGKSKLEISDGVDKFEWESVSFSVVNDEQDVAVPCLISSHNLCSSSAFLIHAKHHSFIRRKIPDEPPCYILGRYITFNCLAFKSQTQYYLVGSKSFYLFSS